MKIKFDLPRIAAAVNLPNVLPAAPVLTVVLLNQFFNVGASASFALSGWANTTGSFVLWQIIGGLFGLGTQLTFAGLVRFTSLGVANVIGNGLAYVSVQIFAAYVLFHEEFTMTQWAGAVFVFIGIVLISLGH